NLDAYPGPEARERELEELAVAAGRRVPGVEILEYGRSVAGRALRAVRVPMRVPMRGGGGGGGSEGGPKVLVCANTHGPEFIGNRVCTAMLRELGERDDSPVHRLIDRAELW